MFAWEVPLEVLCTYIHIQMEALECFVIVSPVLDQTYLHSLFMYITAHASYIQLAGLEVSYLQLI